MLDTNVVSYLMRDPAAGRDRIATLGEEGIAVSAIVAAELRFGVLKKGSARLAHNLEAILAAIEVSPWEAPADIEYARLRLALETSGRPIGPNDMLIAAHALAFGVPLVTANLDEFLRVPGLAVIRW